MAETYRRGKTVEYVGRILHRQNVFKEQLTETELPELKWYIQGQIQALDLVIKELIKEFEVTTLELGIDKPK